jgi:hypothetical protein
LLLTVLALGPVATHSAVFADPGSAPSHVTTVTPPSTLLDGIDWDEWLLLDGIDWDEWLLHMICIQAIVITPIT